MWIGEVSLSTYRICITGSGFGLVFHLLEMIQFVMRICFTLVGKKHHLAMCFSSNWPREYDCKVNRSCGFDRDIGHEKMVMFPSLLNS